MEYISSNKVPQDDVTNFKMGVDIIQLIDWYISSQNGYDYRMGMIAQTTWWRSVGTTMQDSAFIEF